MLSMLLLASCTYKIERLSFRRDEYQGSNIRFDGYYYYQTSHKAMDGIEQITHFIFFYRNGVAINYNIGRGDLEIVDKKLTDSLYRVRLKRSFYSYGIYRIKDNAITINKWGPPTYGRTVHTYNLELKVVNDTTLQNVTFSEIQKFRKFKPKPDSITEYLIENAYREKKN